MDYQETDYGYDDYGPQDPNGNSIKGLKIAIAILIVFLIALGFLYFRQVQNLRGESEVLMEEKDTLTNRLSRLMGDYSGLQFDNDTLNQNLITERGKADSLMQKLTAERKLSLAKLKQYEREVGTLRATMQGFVRQIDSLNTLNKKLTGENVQQKKTINALQKRVEAAEETTSELDNKLKRGQVIRARNIQLIARNRRDKEIVKARQADRLECRFTLSANELATPGERSVYVTIIDPDGIAIQGARSSTVDIEGETTPFTASRSVEYQGEDLPVSVFYPEGDEKVEFQSGLYTVMVYMDGMALGSEQVNLK